MHGGNPECGVPHLLGATLLPSIMVESHDRVSFGQANLQESPIRGVHLLPHYLRVSDEGSRNPAISSICLAQISNVTSLNSLSTSVLGKKTNRK